MSAPLPETTCLVWYCSQCRNACKVQPQVFEPGCTCKTPVMPLQPTRVTQMHEPKRRPVHALSDDEAALRGLIHARKRLRITYEADIAEAWTESRQDGSKSIQLIVTTPDGRRHAVDTSQPGVRVEAAETDTGGAA